MTNPEAASSTTRRAARSGSDGGRDVATIGDVPTPDEELQAVIFSKVGSAKARILKALVDVYPDPLDRLDTATALPRSQRSEVIDYPERGHVGGAPGALPRGPGVEEGVTVLATPLVERWTPEKDHSMALVGDVSWSLRCPQAGRGRAVATRCSSRREKWAPICFGMMFTCSQRYLHNARAGGSSVQGCCPL